MSAIPATDTEKQGQSHRTTQSGDKNNSTVKQDNITVEYQRAQALATVERQPWGLRWRASVGFITLVVGLGIASDLIVYSILIPVLPFRLQDLGYTGVSALVGYLLFAYSGGLAVSTPPIAWLSERYKSRQWPLLIGLVALVGSQIMLMEAPAYWVMALARVLQGISSSMVWVVGLALLCDTTPEQFIGRQLGIAMSGLSLGLLIGPPVGGALYTHFGFRGPCIFAVIITVFDLLGRLLLIERKDALRYGFDPAAVLMTVEAGGSSGPSEIRPDVVANPVSLSPLAVIWELAKSPRALTALLTTLIWGTSVAGQEPTLPLHLQAIWGLNSSQVGLVFIAGVVPTLISAPIAGWLADRKGAEWVTVLCLGLALPWWFLLLLQSSFVLFVVVFAIESFFTAALAAPLTTELASVARSIPNMGYAHVYGAFNLAYGIGSAIGPLISGQIYRHLGDGWLVICVLFAILLAASFALSLAYTGERSILTRFLERLGYMGTITLPGEGSAGDGTSDRRIAHETPAVESARG